MIPIAPDVFYVLGNNKSRFPYCSGLYVKGKKLRVLIDAGMGADQMDRLKQMGIDLLLLTHCHIDHRLYWHKIPEVPVWCHELDAGHMIDPHRFYSAVGMARGGIDLTKLLGYARKIFPIPVKRYLTDGQEIDLGGVRLVVLHTPGHTPGHLSFYIPEHDLLFSGDVDLTSFGPFYGHDFSSIDDFLDSIAKLKKIGAKKVVTAHAGPFEKELSNLFDAYADVVFKREQQILALLQTPRSLDDFQGLNLIYRTFSEGDDINPWFERVHIEKHLERLTQHGKVCRAGNLWRTL